MSAQVAKVLRDAAQSLESDGWCQGHLFEEQRSCAMGAIVRVTHWTDVAATYATQALDARTGDIITWNDKPGRTQAEVVKLFLTVADLEEVKP